MSTSQIVEQGRELTRIIAAAESAADRGELTAEAAEAVHRAALAFANLVTPRSQPPAPDPRPSANPSVNAQRAYETAMNAEFQRLVDSGVVR